MLLYYEISFAQFTIHGAANGDVNVDVKITSNTGIAIAPSNDPGLQFIAIAYDTIAVEHYIHWYDKNGNFLYSMQQATGDPDVAYIYNIDLLAIVSYDATLGGELWLDIYAYNSSQTPLYFRNGTWGPDGIYPNIDINSFGHGIISFERNDSVFLTVPTLNYSSPGFSNSYFVDHGTQPDVVITDDSTIGIVTYVDSGDLYIVEFDYQAFFQGGTFNAIDTHYYPANGKPFAFPRIASSRNVNFTSVDHWTVVAERDSHHIQAVSFEGNSVIGPYTVDTGLVNCRSSRPVVTYTENKIVFAWAEDYSSCSHSNTVNGSTEKDVLLREFDATTLNMLNSNDMFEVNRFQGTFHHAIPAISSSYDGNFPLMSSGDGLEAIIYNDADSVYFKPRTYSTAYRRSNPQEKPYYETIAEDSKIKLIENPVSGKTIRLLKHEGLNVEQLIFFSLDGTQHNLNLKNTTDVNHINVDVSQITEGMYFLKIVTTEQIYSVKVIIR